MAENEIVSELIKGGANLGEGLGFTPLGPGASMAAPSAPAELPKSIDDLKIQVSRTYDLSVSAAAKLSIPVIGSVSGGVNRRVVVLERAAYKEIADGETKIHYGYAIRLAVTVNKLSLDTKVTLPFLAASAEIGTIEAKWVLQVSGLAGKKIDEVSITPTELNVETFVLAKQSLVSLIAAVRDPGTSFEAQAIEVIKPADGVDAEYLFSIGRVYALGRLEKGVTRMQALRDLGTSRSEIVDAVVDTYRDFAGLTSDMDHPSAEVRSKAISLLGPVKVTPR